MKKLLLIIFSLTMLDAVSYANKIVITGTPIILEKQGDVYFVPNDYKSTTSYYYVSLNGARQVCYIDKQPELSALNTTTLEVNYNGSTLTWVCYPLDTNYFETP
ncbi:hypothetical protein OQJ19_12685 [Fluoribacter gormanii]|uniref:Uncharacterized protein n=1 Tax=Fluoribacter gormanii TaxID=464 RepID=A0A377GLE8_9GAMM|nr:hypothetical protein [Fluoribacter gormanii]KTD01836.1 hypothetical protein Lgor_2213 [Fluoribacter gormanii]MCW8443005.1 hypothetical protein [Fluoribacter gormanii]MCW8471496.1 hypothetical protein [Fluoribacter gormanii]SIR22539.1 hypothetical protein SAMN05421777_10882 [Fluoribacter gormanii]STO25393.1 Uncharacterised protein [Fluoribacter gormanii]